MIRLKLNEMLETRGLSAYALHIKSQGKLHQSVISKIKKNESKALQIDTLDMLCELLDCQPADLIVYESATQSAIATQSETTTQNVERATRNAKHTQNVDATQSASDNDLWLSTKAVAERLGVSRKSVNDYIIDGKLPATKGENIPNHKGNRTHNFVHLDDVLIYQTVYKSGDLD